MKRILVATLAALALTAAPAHAAVFTVTTSADTSPQLPAGCTAIACSLRQAVAAAVANGNGAADQIVVPAGTYTLSFGALAVGSSATGIAITGASAATTIISANKQSQVLTLGGETSVTVSGVTLRDGNAATGPGGNVQVGNTATLGLDHVRVTAGTAATGGGIAATTSRLLVIASSLIDGNVATGAGGGGLFLNSGTTTVIRDSTIAFNTASLGAGIDVPSNTSATQLRAVTLAGNQGGGLNIGTSTPVSAGGSILAGNTPVNCAGVAPSDAGANLESGSECGLAGHQNTDPQLAPALADGGGQTPTLALAPTSPAVDIVPTCLSAADQRDVPRPQGAACDAGAYELIPPAPPPPAPTPTPTPAPTPPTPKFHSLVVIGPVSGKVLVRLPGSSKYTAVDAVTGIPLGATVDARDGHVRLTSVPKAGGAPQSAEFWDGIFKVTQPGAITQLQLVEPLAACPKAGKAAIAAKKPKTRRLWGSGTGSFRTRGQYSAATVRGTKWFVEDSCGQTLTRVAHGVVSVRDEVKHKTIVLRAGKRYIARRRG